LTAFSSLVRITSFKILKFERHWVFSKFNKRRVVMKKTFILIAAMAGLSGCATYNYAQNMKMVGFDDNAQKGTAVGNIRGEDCTWNVLGQQLGGFPTVDRAFMNAKNQAGAMESAGFDKSGKDRAGAPIRYVNNVSTANDGFNAVLFGKQCIVVTGVGYR
jgi:hypothetical protein